MGILFKEATTEDIELSIHSVAPLNDAISEKYEGDDIQLIVWASDLHLHAAEGYPFEIGSTYNHVDSSRQFTLCLHEINALRPKPEFLVLGGDITDLGMLGMKDEWKEFARILNAGISDVKSYPMFGNHDNHMSPIRPETIAMWSEIKQAHWPELTDSDALYYAFRHKGFKHIVLDTVIHSKEKRVSDKQLEWLEAELNESLPTLVYLHAPLLPIANWAAMGYPELKPFYDRIAAAEQVLGVFSGHVHMPFLWQYYGKLYCTFPACAYGIGAETGWGGIILKDNKIDAVFHKSLAGESYDDCTGHRRQDGRFEFMIPQKFQQSAILNPFYWKREKDPLLRD